LHAVIICQFRAPASSHAATAWASAARRGLRAITKFAARDRAQLVVIAYATGLAEPGNPPRP
jgi:hypothetical protein